MQSSGEDLFFGDKTINLGKTLLNFALAGMHATAMHRLFFRESVLSYTIHSTRPIKGVHKSCFCFAVVQSSGRAKGLKM